MRNLKMKKYHEFVTILSHIPNQLFEDTGVIISQWLNDFDNIINWDTLVNTAFIKFVLEIFLEF